MGGGRGPGEVLRPREPRRADGRLAKRIDGQADAEADPPLPRTPASWPTGWCWSGTRARRKAARCRRCLANVLLDEVDKELERRGHAFVRYADDCNVYVRSKRAGERVMELLRRLYAELRLANQRDQERGGAAVERKFLGYSFWVAKGREVETARRAQGPRTMKERVREITRRNGGRSIDAGRARSSRCTCSGWKAYFRLAETPRRLPRSRRVDPSPPAGGATQAVETRADRLSASCALGASRSMPPASRRPTRRRWWRNSRDGAQHRLAHQLLRPTGSAATCCVTSTHPNRPVRTRMPGGVAGDAEAISTPLCRFQSNR